MSHRENKSTGRREKHSGPKIEGMNRERGGQIERVTGCLSERERERERESE